MKKYTSNYIKRLKDIYKYEHMFGGGLASTDALSSGATILNRIDYNIKSMKVL